MSQLLATGTRVVYDTTDDMTLDQAKQAARDELGGEVGLVLLVSFLLENPIRR